MAAEPLKHCVMPLFALVGLVAFSAVGLAGPKVESRIRGGAKVMYVHAPIADGRRARRTGCRQRA